MFDVVIVRISCIRQDMTDTHTDRSHLYTSIMILLNSRKYKNRARVLVLDKNERREYYD